MLKEMQKLNIICDLSHANDAAFWEIIETTPNKICATHSNCAMLCSHARNLTDEMMQALAKRDGVMGLVFYGKFIDENKPSLERFVQHILHALEIMGPDHVGIGSDFDGVEPGAFMAISHPEKINDLWEALDKAGINAEIMRKIAHENFLRLIDC
jgi:membrane dipeptidase